MAADAVEAANPKAVKPMAAAAPSFTNSLIQASPVIVSPLRSGNGESGFQFRIGAALQKLNYRLVGYARDIRLQLVEIHASAVAARFIAKSVLNRLARAWIHTPVDESLEWAMRRFAFLGVAAILVTGSTASAQMFTPLPNSCQKLSSGAGSASGDNQVIYLRAACVAAQAGTTSPMDGRLTREELMSILMLMSLQQTPRTHAS